MISVWKAGIALGVLVAVWTFLMGFSQWYKDPTLQYLFWAVIIIQIGVLIWGLTVSARQEPGYWKQVGTGVMISVIGAVIIFFSSLLFTTVVFPRYFEEVRAAGVEVMKSQGMSDARIAEEVARLAPTQTPFLQALFGVIGTIVTGFVISLPLAAIFRKK
jgi:hypothetical protein